MKKTLLSLSIFGSSVFSVIAQGFNPNDLTPNSFPSAAVDAGASGASFGQVSNLLTFFQSVVDQAVPILIGLGLLAFFWFLVMFIWKGGENPEVRKKSLGGMGWSIVAIFVMVSIWGIIIFIGTILGIEQGGEMHGFIPPGQTAP